MLKRLDPSIGGLRIGLAKFMDGTNVALVGKLGPLGIERKVIGDFETNMSVTLKEGRGLFENSQAGKDVRLNPTNDLEVFFWSDDALGYNTQTVRRISPNIVNQDPELRHFIHNPERGS